MAYAIERTDPDRDRVRILDFWNQHHPEKALDGKFRWMYEHNPQGKASVFVVKKTDGDEWVGMVSVFPVQVAVAGETRIGGVLGDFFVRQDHRSVGPALLLLRSVVAAVKECGLDFLFLFPNTNAEPIVKRAGFRVLGLLANDTRIFRVSPYLGRIGVSPAIARLAGTPADNVFGLLSRETWILPGRKFVFRQVAVADARFDEAWHSWRARFPVAVERTSAYLNWKYLHDPDHETKIAAVFTPDESRLLGYAVFSLRREERETELRDFLCDSDQEIAEGLLAYVLREGRREGMNRVWTSWMVSDLVKIPLKRFGFKSAPSGRSVYISVAEGTGAGQAALTEQHAWFLSWGNRDT